MAKNRYTIKIAAWLVSLVCLGALSFAVATGNGLKFNYPAVWAAETEATPLLQRQSPTSQPAFTLAANLGFGTRLDNRLAKLPGTPQFKGQSREPVKPSPKTPPAEVSPRQKIDRRGLLAKSPLNPSAWGARGDDATNNSAALQAMIAALGPKPATVKFHPGIYRIGRDLSFPANIHLVFMKGAMLKPGRVPGKGTLTYTPTTASTTIVKTSSTCVILAAADTKLKVGMYVTAGNPRQTRKIRFVGPDSTWFETWQPFSPAVSGSFTHSNITVDCTEASGLTFGDYIYAGGQTLVNRNLDHRSKGKRFFTRGYPAAALPPKTHWQRGVRIIIRGPIDAGLYQICTGDGNLKFARGTVQSVRPEWWGAKADGRAGQQAALNSAAIDKALNCHYGDYRIPVQFAAGNYKIASEIWLDDSVHLIGVGSDGYLRGGTVIAAAHNNFHVIQDVPNRGYSDKRIENLTIIAGQGNPCDGLNVTNNTRDLWVYNCTFYVCGGYGIFTKNWGIGEIAHCKITGCVGGFYLNAFDMKVHDNEIMTSCTSDLQHHPYSLASGHLLATAADRDKWTGWTKGWTWSAHRATHRGGGGTAALTQKLPHTMWKGWPYRLIFKVTGGTRGTVTPVVGGVAGTPVPFNGGQRDQVFTMTSTQPHPTLEFRPTADFDGTIDCAPPQPKSKFALVGIILKRTGDGILLASSNSLVSGNIIYGDGFTFSGIRLAGSSTNVITNNRFDSCYYNIFLDHGGGIISNNNIIGDAVTPKTIANIYGIASSAAIIENNRIANNVNKLNVWGIYFASDCGNCVVSHNEFNNHDANHAIYYNTTPTPGDYPLIEDNYGIDLQCPWPVLPTGTPSPKIVISKRWQTKNETPTQIVNFSQGCNGKEIILVFGDSHTTLKFTGNTRLKGHGGLDWHPVAGDHLRAVKKGDYWYSACFEGSKR